MHEVFSLFLPLQEGECLVVVNIIWATVTLSSWYSRSCRQYPTLICTIPSEINFHWIWKLLAYLRERKVVWNSIFLRSFTMNGPWAPNGIMIIRLNRQFLAQGTIKNINVDTVSCHNLYHMINLQPFVYKVFHFLHYICRLFRSFLSLNRNFIWLGARYPSIN